MNRLSTAKRAQIVRTLVEGSGLQATSRMTNVSINTVTRLLAEIGTACARFQDAALRGLPCKRIECDEIRAFGSGNARNVPCELHSSTGPGEVSTWTAICADTKLVPSWLVSTRGAGAAYAFMTDLASRLRHRVELTTDGHAAHLLAVEGASGLELDYATLAKMYGVSPQAETCRPARLTSVFGKKAERYGHAVALHCMHHNFARLNQALRVAPAMAAGVSNHVWSIAEIVGLLEIPAGDMRSPTR